MNIIKWFKRKRPQPVAAPKLSIEDLLVLRWWGYTPAEWDALALHVKAAKRDGYAHSWGLGS